MSRENDQSNFETPGQHVYKGVNFPGGVRPEVLQWVESSLTLRNDDILLVSYPKTGSTWVQAIVYLILNTKDVHQGALSQPAQNASYFLDMKALPGQDAIHESMEKLPHPRFVRTHILHRFMKSAIINKPRIIIPMRNPKDTLVSFYHFYRMFYVLGYYKGSWDNFFELFTSNKLIYGNWFDHTLGWWEQRDQENILFIKYEDMQDNLEKVILKVSNFLSKELTETEIIKIAEMTTFDQMKACPETNMMNVMGFDNSISQFMRKGKVGDWKNYFTVAQNEYFDKLYNERMAETGLNLRFEM